MTGSLKRLLTAGGAIVALAGTAIAAPPFSEDFSTGTAGWRYTTSDAVPLEAVASGGPDGGAYIRNNLASMVGSSASSTTVLLFRAHKTYAGIDLGYTGDWIAAGVKQVSAFVRHNAPDPLEFIARFSPEANFPGAFYATSPLVAPGAWTEVFFNVTPTSPQVVTYEGANYEDVFQGFDNSGIANMQFGVTIPDSLKNTGPYAFEFDKVNVSLTPEPGAGLLAALGAAAAGLFLRRKS